MADSNFTHFSKDIDQVWTYKLHSEFNSIQRTVYDKLGKHLQFPTFIINDNISTKWGSWRASDRTITMSKKLFQYSNWGAVVYVLKHEVAHMIVSEIYKMDCDGVAHGEAFANACAVLDIPVKTCVSHDFLVDFPCLKGDPIIDRVRKLMVKGNDGSISEAEAELFLVKARQLMAKYNIELSKVIGSEKFFIKRPVGRIYKKMPRHVFELINIMKEYYNVRPIVMYAAGGHYIEFFGEASQLDVAEYIYHALLNQAEILYQSFLAEKKITDLKKKEEQVKAWGYAPRARKASKNAFYSGLASGYLGKLREQENLMREGLSESISASDYAMVATSNEELLSEMFNEGYGKTSRISSGSITGAGYSAGQSAGRSLRLSHGVNSSGARGNLLNA